MTVRQQADYHQQEDDEDPEDNLDLSVPEEGDSVSGPGLAVVVGRHGGPAITHPLPLKLIAGDSVTRDQLVRVFLRSAPAHLGRWGAGGS